MKPFILITALLSSTFALTAQGHLPVFPDLEGTELINAVRSSFKPGSVLVSDVARDILYGTIYKQNDSVRCIYTDWPVVIPPGADPSTAVFQNGAGLNLEHSWPQTYGAEFYPPNSDMHHLFPSRVSVNGDRGSLPFGEIPDSETDRWYYLNQTLSSPPSQNRDLYSEFKQNLAFEPREGAKGNIARAQFYFMTMYPTEAGAEGTAFFEGQRSTLCVWHFQDPVDADEWNRTYLIADYQDEKPNPYILDCTLVSRAFCPEFADFNCITTATDPVAYQPLAAVLFPNPGSRQRQLQVQTEHSGTLHIRLYNSLGQLVSTSQAQLSQGMNTLSMEWPHHSMGHCDLIFDDGLTLWRKHLSIIGTEK
ncbi:MAG: endonuclease [Saprospiraceae bacterium]